MIQSQKISPDKPKKQIVPIEFNRVSGPAKTGMEELADELGIFL